MNTSYSYRTAASVFLPTIAGQKAKSLPPMVIEEIVALSAKHGVDLNTCREDADGFLIGEPRTGLTIRATRNGAKFGL